MFNFQNMSIKIKNYQKIPKLIYTHLKKYLFRYLHNTYSSYIIINTGFTMFQVHNILSSIDFKLRDLSNTFRRDQQTERINARIDTMFNKLSHLEVSNGMWFDKFQQVL